MDLYSHVIPDMQDELADAVADVLSRQGRHEFCSSGGQKGKKKPLTVAARGFFFG